MKTRNELAHDYLCHGGAGHRDYFTRKELEIAFSNADAFLAAAGEQKAEQREPDAVWELDVLPGSGVRRILFDGDHPVAVNPDLVDALRAGRERVRLLVYVEEVGRG